MVVVGGAPAWNLDTRSEDSEDPSSILRLDQGLGHDPAPPLGLMTAA